MRRASAAGRSADSGFTMIELLVVMVIVGALIATSIAGMTSWRKHRYAAAYGSAASAIWDGVQAYRLDHRGNLPSYGQVNPAGLRDNIGRPYVKHWPQDPRTGEALVVRSGGAVRRNASYADGVYYSGGGQTGAIAAYGGRGDINFHRVVGSPSTFGIG